ncbi:MAG: DUF4392 domain-containing protein [Clostridiaceae bacterium]|nr:DUF4392 domain-containing protein [Clostridiaceae bacterium]
MEFQEAFHAIEEVITKDQGNRGLGAIAKNGNLYSAVKELHTSSTVMIVTGFCIKDTMVGETDGPIGAVSLANALYKLGKQVILVTDEYSHGLLKVSLEVLKIKIMIEVVPFEETDTFCLNLLDKYKPSHIIAIERPGRAEDGRCYSMRGEDISEVIPNTDILLEKAKEFNIVTIAIGDGGNEVGMGNIKSLLSKLIPMSDKICAVTKTDYLIVAGVSNWGAHGVVAGLSLLDSHRLLYSEDMERNILAAIVKAGAVDGCSKKTEMTVDGLSLEININIVKNLHNIIEKAIGADITEIVDLTSLQYS